METRGVPGTGLFLGKKASDRSIYDRYTDAARNAITFARCEALRRGTHWISAADLLSGLSEEESTRAGRIGGLKKSAFYLRWLTGLPSLPSASAGENSQDRTIHTEFDAEARKALAFAVAEADRDREYWIDSDHLLRGLMRFPNKAHFAILKTEIDLASARIASLKDREEFLPDQTPSFKVVQYLVLKHIALWIPSLLSLACYLYILMQSVGMELSPLAR